MRYGRLTAVAFVALLVATRARAGEPVEKAPIAVVVGTASEVKDVTLDTLRELFLRRRRVWPNGRRVIPVNLPADDPVRKRFSKRVLGRLPEDLVGYWNRRYFEGVQPPLVLQTPQAVCAYVAVEPDAIGYVPRAEVKADACRVVFLLPGEDG